jgi:hypothetical protein
MEGSNRLGARPRRRRNIAVEVLENRTVLASLNGFPAIANTGIAPPDPSAAAGPASLIAVVEGQIQIQSKSGIPISSGPLEGSASERGFFDSVDHQIGPPLLSVYDPHVVFDSYSQRFFVIAAETQSSATERGNAGGAKSYVLLAVSTTSTPTGLDLATGGTPQWLFYSISVARPYSNPGGSGGLAWIDQPKLATDPNFVYIAGDYNSFGNGAQQQFQLEGVTRLDKTSLLAGTFSPSNPSQRIDRIAVGVSAPQKPLDLEPVQSRGLPAGAPEVFVDALSIYNQNTTSGSGGGIRVWTMDPATADLQEVGTVAAPFAFNIAAGAPQAGSTLPISLRSEDSRLSNAVLQNGSIWTSQTVLSPDGASNVRWLQIQITAHGFLLNQSGFIAPGPGIFTYMPAVAVDAVGDVGIVYTQSSASQFATLMFSGRRVSDAGGTLEGAAVVKASNAPYLVTGFGGTSLTRLGESTSIALDPSDLATFWTFGEYAEDSKNWGTWLGSETFGSTPVPGDYSGDGKTDIAIYQFSTATWYILTSTGSFKTLRTVQFGEPFVDIPVPADYDGDGKTDIAVYRPSTGQWFILGSTSGPRVVSFGAAGVDIPVPADYDGDHKADLAVYRPTTGQWLIMQSTAGPRVVSLGTPNVDVPVPADYDGDGLADPAVFAPSIGVWTIDESTLGMKTVTFGPNNFQAVPVPADIDGDGKVDLAVFAGATATWSILDSSTNQPDPSSMSFGPPNFASIAVQGEYTAAGQTDIAIFVPLVGKWVVYHPATKTTHTVAFGTATGG